MRVLCTGREGGINDLFLRMLELGSSISEVKKERDVWCGCLKDVVMTQAIVATGRMLSSFD